MIGGSGAFVLTATTPLFSQADEPVLRRAMPVAVEMLATITGGRAPLGEADAPRDGAVFLGRLAGETNAEAYTLEVTPARVVLRAGGPAGLIHGLASLRQLAGTGREVPAVFIADGPRFPWRGVMLDCCRHYMSVAFIEDVLDLMALYKLNRFHWHLTEDQAWRLAIDRYPRLTEVGAWRTEPDGSAHGGYYTQADARRIVAYAADRGITVVPEIELPGHSRAAIAAYPELSCTGEPLPVPCWWGVFEDVYCAGNEEVFTLLTGVLEEVLAIFPSREIHLGGDEVPRDRWRACPKCQARIATEGLADEAALQSWFVRRIGAWLAARDRRLVGWDEILEGGALPGGAVVQSWRGLDGAVAAARAGHDVVVSPTSHCYLDYDLGVTDLARAYAFEPVPGELSAEEAQHILGGEMNLWTEYAPQELAMGRLLPRLLALSEVLWSPAPPLAAAAGPKVGDPAVIGRDYTEFWGRVKEQYALLDAMGVRRGHEARPLRLAADWEPQVGGWRVSGAVGAVVPAGQAVIRWRQGDGEPTPADAALDAPAVVATGGRLSARLFIDGAAYGETAEIALVRNLALERGVTTDPPPSAKYAPRVAFPLTDGILGSLDYRDGTWLAWEGVETVVAVVDLGGVIPVRECRARFLQDANSWIWVPLEVAFAASTDGDAYTEVGRDTCRVSDKEQARVTQDFVAAARPGTTARFVKVTVAPRQACPAWHPGAGRPAWAFWGQVVVE